MAGNRIDTVRDIGRGIPDPATTEPKPLGATAEIGTSQEFARSDHVHKNTGDWAYLTLSAGQYSSVNVDNHIAWDIIKKSGNFDTYRNDLINISNWKTGSEAVQDLGIVELKAGKTYELSGTLYPHLGHANAIASWQWYDRTNSMYIGQGAYLLNINYSSYGTAQPVAFVIITPAIDTKLELRMLESQYVSGIMNKYSYAKITQIKDEET